MSICMTCCGEFWTIYRMYKIKIEINSLRLEFGLLWIWSDTICLYIYSRILHRLSWNHLVGLLVSRRVRSEHALRCQALCSRQVPARWKYVPSPPPPLPAPPALPAAVADALQLMELTVSAFDWLPSLPSPVAVSQWANRLTWPQVELMKSTWK